MKNVFKLIIAVICLTILCSLTACLNSGQTKDDAKVNSKTFDQAMLATDCFSGLISDSMWDYGSTTEKNFKMLFTTKVNNRDTKLLTIVRDGNKACVTVGDYYIPYDGKWAEQSTYLVFHGGTFDYKSGRNEWVREQETTKNANEFLINNVNSVDGFGNDQNPLSDFDFTFKDFTYNITKKVYTTDKTFTVDEYVYEDISLKFYKNRLIKFNCVCKVQDTTLPITITFEYNDRGNLPRAFTDQESSLNGAVVSVKCDINILNDDHMLFYDDPNRVTHCSANIVSKNNGTVVYDQTIEITIKYENITLDLPE